jgi:hypothetical protein
MTHFAPVSPLAGLRRLAKTPEALGTYQLLIAPVILKDTTGYRKFFQEHDDQFVIVDNGVIELGYALTADELFKAAYLVDAQLVVMPDTIDDAEATLEQTQKALSEFRALDRATDTMGVVQGTTFEECMECARSLVDLGVDWLAPPRGLTKNLGTRVPLVQALASEFGLPMHVLGFSDNIEDDLMAAMTHRSVRGIDAATPSWLPSLLPPVPPTDSRYLGKRPKNFWDAPLGIFAEQNILTVHRWLTAVQSALTGGGGLVGQMGQQTLDL